VSPAVRDDEAARSEHHIRAALTTRDGALALFDDLARRAKPWNGAAQLLRILGEFGELAVRARRSRSRMLQSTPTVDDAAEGDLAMAAWVPGDLLVELRPSEAWSPLLGVEVEIVARVRQHGLGVGGEDSFVSVLAPVFFEIPFDELRWFIERVPELAGPLFVRANHARVTMEMLPETSAVDELADAESTAERPAVTEQILDAMRPQFMTPIFIPPEDLLAKSRS
jgi:hypothetical protein